MYMHLCYTFVINTLIICCFSYISFAAILFIALTPFISITFCFYISIPCIHLHLISAIPFIAIYILLLI